MAEFPTIKVELADEDRERLDAFKAGARHSASDQEHMNSAMDHMVKAGAMHPRLSPLDPTGGFDPGKALVTFGAEAKALGDGRVGGYLVRFSDDSAPDLTGDFFTDKTDFGDHATTPVLYQHGMDSVIKGREIGRGTLRKDAVGVWVEAQLNLRDDYEKAIYALAEQGKLGWSSGTASHLVGREPTGKAYWIKSWPLGLDASLTPTPAEPRNAAIPLKTYADSLLTAEQPAPNGAQDTPAKPTVSTVQPNKQELKTMANETNEAATAQAKTDFDQLMAAIKGVTDAVTLVKKDVDAMKAEPPIKTGGLADALAAGQAPAMKTTPKESYADEQLSAMKAYLNKEIGPTEWAAHNQTIAKRDANQNNAFKALTHAYKDGGRAEAAFGEAMKASMIEGTASLGGNLVPQLYGNQVIGKLKEASIVRQAGAYQFPVAGGYKFQVPTITRSGSAPIANEMGAASQMEPTFGTVDFQAYAYRAQYIASREQVLDSRVPLESLMMENAAWQFTQSENNHLAIGTGSSQPQGIAVAASTLGVSPGSTVAIAFASASGSDNILDVYHGLPYQYRPTACWFANDSTIKAIRKIRSGGGGAASLGDYMWVAGFGDKPDTLLGRPIYPLNNMATSGSTAAVLIFGDPRFFWVADFYNGGLDFQVLNELYAASAAIGWWFWKRFDSHLVVSESVVGLKLLS